MLNVLSVFLSNGDPSGEARAAESVDRQGFVLAHRLEWVGGVAVVWGDARQRHIENCVVQCAVGTACSVGPLWFRGHFGREALDTLLGEVQATGHLDEEALRGNFALFVHTEQHTWLLNDALGFVRINASQDGCFFSTSWLAACAYLPNVNLDAASSIEYVLAGAAHSCQTVAQGVKLLPAGMGVDLRRHRTWGRFRQAFDPRAPQFVSPQEATGTISGYLREVSSEISAAFPGRINTALSGGFDSRLIVAGLLAVGAQPKLFVYGRPDSADVSIAKAVADATNLSIDAIDKQVMNRRLPVAEIESLEQSALFFDGLPSDGIDDRGADRVTRLQQIADGRIALNGGGGEIFRNFFHLPDRSFTARQIVRTFYRGFSARVFRHANGLEAYEARLAASMRGTLGMAAGEGDTLSRAQVELLYPLFRCHYWMAVNNSVALRHGYYATPLVDLASVRLALRVPLRWKNAGWLQSRLIAALHPAIAAQPSAYGFSFDAGPSLSARLNEWVACARPVCMRPMINATRRRLRSVRVAPELLQRYRALLPGEWRMDSLLDLTQLPDDGALGRALAIEVVWRRIL